MSSISVPTSAGAVQGHLAIPVTPGPWPAVVVVHQVYGLDDDIRHIADKFAGDGYLAFAPNYGQLPKHLNAALDSACPVVASYGGLDKSLKGAAAKLEAVLTTAGVEHDVKEYPNSGHSFMNLSEGPGWMKLVQKIAGLNVGYVDTDADDAWQRILAMFATALH